MERHASVADLAMLILSVVFGIGSVALFVAMPSVRYLPLGWPDRLALPWDAFLSLVFFAQHSGMVRRPIRARLAAVFPARYDGAVYSIASGIVLALVAILWQRSETQVFVLHGVPRYAAQVVTILAVAAFVASAVTLRRSFDPHGLHPIRAHLLGQPHQPGAFVVGGPYLWVRHPLYSCILVMFWMNTDVTADMLLFDVLWTIWIVAGAAWEERDLVAEFGAAYRAYQRQVPMLVPWRGRVKRAAVGVAADV